MRGALLLTRDEAILLCNALNDLINAVRWTEVEIENALGLPIESLRERLDRLAVLVNGFGGRTSPRSTSDSAEIAVRSHWRPDYRDGSVEVQLTERDRALFEAALDSVLSGDHFSEAAFHPRMGVDSSVALSLLTELRSDS